MVATVACGPSQLSEQPRRCHPRMTTPDDGGGDTALKDDALGGDGG